MKYSGLARSFAANRVFATRYPLPANWTAPVFVVTYFTHPSRTIAATLRIRHISMAPLAPFWGRGVGGEGAAMSGSVADQESRPRCGFLPNATHKNLGKAAKIEALVDAFLVH